MRMTRNVLKTIVLLSLSSTTLPVLAFSGFSEEGNPHYGYVNADAGISFHDHQDNVDALKSRYKKEGLAGRVAAGYAFHKILSAEMGYGRYHTVNYRHTFLSQPTVRGHVKYQALDALVKATMPVGDVMGLYADAGVAYVGAKNHSSLRPVDKKFFAPEYGAGVLFNLSDNIQLQTGVKRIEGRHKVSNVNFVHAGLNVLLG